MGALVGWSNIGDEVSCAVGDELSTVDEKGGEEGFPGQKMVLSGMFCCIVRILAKNVMRERGECMCPIHGFERGHKVSTLKKLQHEWRRMPHLRRRRFDLPR